MSIPNTDGLTTEQLQALLAQVKQQLKQGILPTDKAVQDLAEQVVAAAKSANTTNDKVLAAVKLALGGKPDGAHAVSRRNAIRKALRVAGATPPPYKAPMEELENAYIDKFGKADFDEKIAVIPMAKAQKK